MRFAGYGFCMQRPEKGSDAHIKGFDSANTTENLEIFGNVFYRSRHMMIDAAEENTVNAPSVRSNIFFQTEGAAFGKCGENSKECVPYTKEALSALDCGENGNIFFSL